MYHSEFFRIFFLSPYIHIYGKMKSANTLFLNSSDNDGIDDHRHVVVSASRYIVLRHDVLFERYLLVALETIGTCGA